MADLFPKFIIEDGCLIIGKVTYHKDLVMEESKVRGGGWFSVKDNTFMFFGSSHVFGSAKIEDIKQAIENDKVFTNKYQTHSIAKNKLFTVRNGDEILKLN